ncbi:NPHP3 [Bugula neritina]|uniref:NPHP3 n=1 Tax=Bugula neritina TaxID=10212 RepID=A0A7J7KFM9_BUGNE|nr:NPHP3 [Bugula neritina]
MSFSKALARVMGNGGSSLSQAGSQGGLDEDDLNDVDAFHASVLMVPDEVKPRGRIGLRSGNSHNKKTLKSGSMQSALSMDMENPEAERIRREFEMYRKNKENEMANIQKSEKEISPRINDFVLSYRHYKEHVIVFVEKEKKPCKPSMKQWPEPLHLRLIETKFSDNLRYLEKQRKKKFRIY